MGEGYLLQGVTPEEFRGLKRQESHLVGSLLSEFNPHWKPQVEGIKATFKYNSQRMIAGIFFERDGLQQLIEGQELSIAEEAFARGLYEKSKEVLQKLRLPNEKWVDSV